MMYDNALKINPNYALAYSNKGMIIIFHLQELHFKNKANFMKQLKCTIELFK